MRAGADEHARRSARCAGERVAQSPTAIGTPTISASATARSTCSRSRAGGHERDREAGTARRRGGRSSSASRWTAGGRAPLRGEVTASGSHGARPSGPTDHSGLAPWTLPAGASRAGSEPSAPPVGRSTARAAAAGSASACGRAPRRRRRREAGERAHVGARDEDDHAASGPRRSAGAPSRCRRCPAIRTSRSTMSGSASRAMRSAVSPSADSPTSSKPGVRRTQRSRRLPEGAWSSTVSDPDRCRIGHAMHRRQPRRGDGNGAVPPGVRGDAAHCPRSGKVRAMPIRIALGEDSLIVREGVRQLLDGRPGGRGRRGRGRPRLAARRLRRASSPTSCSPTSGCRRRTPTRASASPTELRDTPSRDRRRGAQPVRRPDLRAGAARPRLGPPRLPAQGARAQPRRADRGDPRRRRRRLDDRPEDRRGARARARARPSARR